MVGIYRMGLELSAKFRLVIFFFLRKTNAVANSFLFQIEPAESINKQHKTYRPIWPATFDP